MWGLSTQTMSAFPTVDLESSGAFPRPSSASNARQADLLPSATVDGDAGGRIVNQVAPDDILVCCVAVLLCCCACRSGASICVSALPPVLMVLSGRLASLGVDPV
jgi:hypothetical protein